MSNPFGAIESFFKALGSKIHAGLVSLFGQSAIDAVEAQLKIIFQEDVQAIFLDAIQAAETLSIGGAAATGSQKRDAAFAQIVSDLKTKGISLATSAVNLGIELIVGLLKAKTPTVTG